MSRVEGMGGAGAGEAAWRPAQRIGDGERTDKLTTGRDPGSASARRVSGAERDRPRGQAWPIPQ